MCKLIGIAGKANSGKDTLGNFIKEIDQRYKIVKYADKLKDITSLLIGCDRSMLEDREFKETPLPEQWWVVKNPWGELTAYKKGMTISNACELIKTTPRLLLQKIGTECFRNIIHPDVWVNSTFAEFNEDSRWVVTDVRFKNEIEKIKDNGGVVVRINRPGYEISSNHPSEIQIDTYPDYDLVINNVGSVDDLKSYAERIINS